MSTARLLVETLRFHPEPPAHHLASAWADADLRGLQRLVELEGCAIWLCRRLSRIGALEGLDRQFGSWLAAQAAGEIARSLLIDAEADAVAAVLDRLDIPAVFMKGVARRLLASRYALLDARGTQDVDLIVPAARAWEVWHELRRLGYERTRPTRPPRPAHHHLPALWGAGRVAVEIHTTHARDIPPEESWHRLRDDATEVERGARRFLVPSAAELFWSTAAHALRIPDRAFLLAQMLPAAVLWASGATLNWGEVARRLAVKEIVDSAAAGAWLRGAADLAGADPPPELAGRLADYDLARACELRLTVLKRIAVPRSWDRLVIWWSSDRARRPR